jgi:hypothetical protein
VNQVIEVCKLGKTECLCVGCKAQCEDNYCEDCDGEPVNYCTRKRDAK